MIAKNKRGSSRLVDNNMQTSPLPACENKPAETLEANLVQALLSGDTGMARLMRAHDWEKTPLGPVASWPQSLRTSVSICLASRFPIVLYWGGEYVVLYNDAYSVILGSKHPWALGQTCRECWAEIWDTIGPMLDGVLKTGKATWSDDLMLMLQRFGYPEECYFSFSFSPVQVESGNVGGVFTAVIETTENVISERRLRTLRDLAAQTVAVKSEDDAWQIAASTLAQNGQDVPFAILCKATDKHLQMAGVAGIVPTHSLCEQLCDSTSELFQKVMGVAASGQRTELDLRMLAEDLPGGPWDTAPCEALLLPIAALGQGSSGVLLAAVSPKKRLDESYCTFFDLVAQQIASRVADARSYEEERKRAESLTELDRAKTLFFSNISHELRTPLTLLLGPTESALSSPDAVLCGAELQMVHRNELRLLKLVNTLLDFSRIEAGRIQAIYEPTDLASLTSDVASAFRSAVEKADLCFHVSCEPVDEAIYVDREMWEKIVLNLLSNAFKFTFEGEIAIDLKRRGNVVEMTVRDTGTGIPENELPRVFERFHRIENVRARTYEGTGIGLALVQALVKLHGGSVTVESAVGKGSAFHVKIPAGNAHLPADRIRASRNQRSTALSAEAYIDEAERWLPGNLPQAPAAATQTAEHITAMSEASPSSQDVIVVADDNADMREYLSHLLRGHYRVHAVADGAQAMKAIRQLRPALVLTDVMMPELDGFGVLAAVRSDESLRTIPVILLSARAGEESRLEGLHSGADDYLVKPFTAKELIARVNTHVKMAKVRREAGESEQRLRLAQQAAAIGTFEWHVQTGVNRWTPELEHMYGLETGTFEGTQEAWARRVHPDDLPAVLEQMETSFRTRAPVQAEWRVIWSDRSVHWVLGRWQVFSDETGKPARVAGINIDVTARKTAEDARRRLAAIVESSDDAIISKDLNGIVTSWNRQAQQLFGYTEEEMIGRSILTLIPPELHGDEEMILSKIRSGEKIAHFKTVRLAKSGERIEVSLSISPVRDEHEQIVGAAKIARDIRESNKIERALRTTEKLAAAGRLAATVAHEINNPLEAVTNLIYLAKRDLPNGDKVAAYLKSAEQELNRVAHITRQTLGFYRDTSSPVRFNVPQVLDDLLLLYEKRLETRNIRIVREYDSAAEIIALSGEIRQAFSNLLTNAMDAMVRGGTLTIRVRRTHEWSKDRIPGVRITIADSGSGIAPEHRRHLFQPFFTTKSDVGTGLGLWITRGIVEKHGGQIHVKTRSGTDHGTAFSILLPVQGKAAPRRQEIDSTAKPQVSGGVAAP